MPLLSVPPTGRIDIHSHILPGLDDGCRDLNESLACVQRLREAGFVGSICTPHVWIDMFPDNVPQRIAAETQRLQRELHDRGIDYTLWPGAEVRLYDGIIDWFKAYGVPTLAESRCVLVDFWDQVWPRWAESVFGWPLEHDYQPILAHPERMPARQNLDAHLAKLEAMGVWLQGNALCMTGEEGYHADHFVRQLLAQNRYKLIALDMHRPETLDARLDGLTLIEMEQGKATLSRLIEQAPRELVLAGVLRTDEAPQSRQ